MADLRRELKDIEDLVMQISYFARTTPDTRYVSIIIRNLGRKVLEYLKIESGDIAKLMEHELAHHKYDPHTSKKGSTALHQELELDKDKIKSGIKRILSACRDAESNKLTRSQFQKKIDSACSSVLKTIKSEHHALEMVDSIITHQRKTQRLQMRRGQSSSSQTRP